MTKYVQLMRREASQEREAYFDGLSQAAGELAMHESVHKAVLDIVDVAPEEVGLRSGGQPAFDAVLEFWTDEADLASAMGRAVRGAAGGEMHLYRVSEFLERDYDRSWPDGVVSPGIKSLYIAVRRPDISHEAMAKHWAETHAPLALTHHIGMWRYARNVFDEPLTRDSPAIDGMAELHFRSAKDFREKFYDSEDGRAVIAADIAKFSGPGGKALHTHEYILLS